MARSSSATPSKSSTTIPTKTQSLVQTEPLTVRLHIAPLTPETTTSLIPASVLDEAARQSLSYHTLQTFPENSYAFIDLPKGQAEKLKKRLNGTVFRGVKVRVDEARPETWVKHPEPEPEMEYAEMSKKERKEEKRVGRKRSKSDSELKLKKRKKGEDGILEGVELPEGRKVQRGWTKPAISTTASTKYAGKSASPSTKKDEDDSKRECLFKTPLPPNKTTPKEDKKDKEEKKDKKRRKREVVIKEFKNNTKFPQFLKSSQLDKDKAAEKMANEYVEGVGWVNAKGELVEEEKTKKRAATIAQMEVDAPMPMDESSSEDSTRSDDEDDVMIDVATTIANGSEDGPIASDPGTEKPNTKAPPNNSTVISAKPASSSESGSGSDSEVSSSAEKTSPITPITPIIPAKRTLSSSSISPKAATPTLQITIPTIPTSPIQAVHPLEALYKPTAKNTSLLQVGVTASPSSAAAENGAFKFGFGADNDSETEETEPVIQTPYRERYRSAAPTPDTAIGHRKFFPDDGDDSSSYSGRLGFVPSTPRVIGGFPGGQDLFSRKDGAPYTPTADSPLLFPHSESRFLGALSVWSKLPTPKALTQTEEEPVEEEEIQLKKDKKGKGKGKGKGKLSKESIMEEEEEGEGDAEEIGEKTTADVWSEKFYENRGDWNRAWKGRRREAMKQKRKREAAGGPGSAKRVAT